MKFEDFKMGNSYKCIKEISARGYIAFKENEVYECLAVETMKHNGVSQSSVLLTCETYPSSVITPSKVWIVEDLFDRFELATNNNTTTMHLDNLLEQIYDEHRKGTVSKELLDEYTKLTGKKRPGFMV